MPHDIKMPPLSQTTDEVRLVKWLVKVGDRIRKGDPLCEVENDKSVMPLESVAEGYVLELCISENVSVQAGTVIAILGEKGDIPALRPTESVSPHGPAEPLSKVGDSPDARKRPTGKGIIASHIARHVAEKKGIDLSKVQGTGPGGRIVLKDLETAEKGAVLQTSVATAQPGSPQTTPFSTHQASVARNLVKSKTEIPHFYVTMEIEVSGLLSWIAKTHGTIGTKTSFYSPLVFAAARALAKFPRVNASSRPDGVVMLPAVNVAIAVSVGEDLYVPVVKGADRLGLDDTNSSVKWLIAKAQNRRLEPGDQSSGTITLSTSACTLWMISARSSIRRRQRSSRSAPRRRCCT